jgi:hypothetical protein
LEAGKSALLECVSFLSKNPEIVSEPTAPSLFRMADLYKGWLSLFYDDAQKLGNRSAGSLLGVLLPGYRRGATVPRSAGDSVIKYPVYWPKAFSLIGDLVGTLRDRAIVIPLDRATPKQIEALGRGYVRDEAEGEASVLLPEIGRWVASLPTDEPLPLHRADWMYGRDEEIWTPLYSTLHLLNVDAETRKRFKMISADLNALKTQDAVVYTNAQQEEDKARDTRYGERAIADLAHVIKDDEQGITSADAVKRMRAIPDGPWRTYRGRGGLNEILLSRLVAPFGIAPARLPRKGSEKQIRGYRRVEVRKASKQ